MPADQQETLLDRERHDVHRDRHRHQTHRVTQRQPVSSEISPSSNHRVSLPREIAPTKASAMESTTPSGSRKSLSQHPRVSNHANRARGTQAPTCLARGRRIHLVAGTVMPRSHSPRAGSYKLTHAICLPPFTFMFHFRMADIGAYKSRHLESDVIDLSDVTSIDVVHTDICDARIGRHHTLKKINARN